MTETKTPPTDEQLARLIDGLIDAIDHIEGCPDCFCDENFGRECRDSTAGNAKAIARFFGFGRG